MRHPRRSPAESAGPLVDPKAASKGIGKGPRRRLLIYAALFSVLFIITYRGIYDSRVFMGGDNAEYFMLARSIATGHGFSNISMLDATPHNHFPPGYPFIMAVMMKVGITEVGPLTMMNGVFLWGALVLLLFFFDRWSGSPELAFAVACLCLFNAHLLGYSTIMMSEVPYLFFFTLTLLAYIMLLRKRDDPRLAVRWLAVLIASAILLLYIRTAALAMVGCIALHLAWRRRFLWSGIFAGAVVLSQVPWAVRSASLGGNNYLRQMMMVNAYRPEAGPMHLGDWPHRFWENISRYVVREIPSGILPWTERTMTSKWVPAEEWIWPVLLFPFILYGMFRLRKDRLFLSAAVLSSFALLMFWPPVWKGVRFMLPLVPFLVFFAVYGLFALAQRLAERSKLPSWSAWVVTGAALMGMTVNLQSHELLQGKKLAPQVVQEMAAKRQMKVDRTTWTYYAPSVKALAVDRNNPYPGNYQEYLATAVWARNNLTGRDTAVVCCRKPGLFYLFSRMHVNSFAHTFDPDSLVADLKTRKVTHLVVDQLGFADVGRYLVPLVKGDPLKFPILHTEVSSTDKRKVTYLLGFRPELGYTGAWAKGRKEGQGVMRYSDGSVFSGRWVNDTINGEGTLTRRDGSVIEGHWHAGKLNGWGRWSVNGEVKQEGQWKEGKLLTGNDPAKK